MRGKLYSSSAELERRCMSFYSRHQVGLEFVKIDIKGSIKAE